MGKILNLLNPKKWLDGFLINKFGQKVATSAATGFVAMVLSPHIIDLLQKWGLNIDTETLKKSIVVSILGLLAGLINTAKNGPLKSE